ncbi:MAG: IS200/IS605 family transposase [Anaerolineae bacterium]
MPYWQLFYHLIWSTKNRQPLLTSSVEKQIYGYLTGKATGLKGVVYAIGGTSDHVHLVVSIPPAVSVAKFVGQVKGVASTRFNKSGVSSTHFEWQSEYGAFSFDAKRLPNYIGYVERQKEHHREGSTIPVLERTASENVGPRLLRERASSYATGPDTWRAELLELLEPGDFIAALRSCG